MCLDFVALWPDEEVVINRVYPGQVEAAPVHLLVLNPILPRSEEQEKQGGLDRLWEAPEMRIDLPEIPAEIHGQKR